MKKEDKQWKYIGLFFWLGIIAGIPIAWTIAYFWLKSIY
jgi:hypothetical protein